jgi:acetylornithine aminotransferase/acetylornithine/N-succinyldiaminopimelate aminotransferase
MMDAVQDGHYRTGRFQSFQRILEGTPAEFLPDAISMAKSLGGGFPMGAFWIRAPHGDLFSAGTHGTTFGGSPLACAVALKILEVIDREKLADNARSIGDFLKSSLQKMAGTYPQLITQVRGLGCMLGVELAANIPKLPGDSSKSVSARVVQLLHAEGLLLVPAGNQVLRFLPPLNLTRADAEQGLHILQTVLAKLA